MEASVMNSKQHPRSVAAVVEITTEVLRSHGIEPSQDLIKFFATWLIQCERDYPKEREALLAQNEGAYQAMDILRFIKEAWRVGNKDEAYWRVFLAAHFGRPSAKPDDPNELDTSKQPSKVKSAGRFLCAFGTQPSWTWAYVSTQHGNAFCDLLSTYKDALRTLRFGNHRKMRSYKPGKLARVVTSFAQAVNGNPSAAFTLDEKQTPKENFHRLYHHFNQVYDFGRTGCFDLLCLCKDMRFLAIEPDSCYLVGSTGPYKGAALLCGKKINKPSKAEQQALGKIIDTLAARLEIPYDVMEDALCRWPKTLKEQVIPLPTINRATKR